MLASSLIIKKRDGAVLKEDEIRFLIDGFCNGNVTDYQMAALAMAICIRGMTPSETATLTRAMLETGTVLPRPRRHTNHETKQRPRVDKHSTGGLGDKVSLILAPLLASCGVDVPMISGRGLGTTGGTLDKLESIAGFQTEFLPDQTSQLLDQSGAFIIGASQDIAPADRSLYALRDVTGTVESIPLITASILSKKLAANLDSLVMDVKCGSGAFMKNASEAIGLARSLVQVGDRAGLPTTALITDMDQPLGHAVGNAIEVIEAIDVLDGKKGPVRDLTIALAAQLLVQVDQSTDTETAAATLEASLDGGHAMEKFERLVAAQGGDLQQPFQLAPECSIKSDQSGYIRSIDCRRLGETIIALKGGRRQKGDPIDHSVGIYLHVKVGDPIDRGQQVLTLHASVGVQDDYHDVLRGAFELSDEPVEPSPLILGRVTREEEVLKDDGDQAS